MLHNLFHVCNLACLMVGHVMPRRVFTVFDQRSVTRPNRPPRRGLLLGKSRLCMATDKMSEPPLVINPTSMAHASASPRNDALTLAASAGRYASSQEKCFTCKRNLSIRERGLSAREHFHTLKASLGGLEHVAGTSEWIAIDNERDMTFFTKNCCQTCRSCGEREVTGGRQNQDSNKHSNTAGACQLRANTKLHAHSTLKVVSSVDPSPLQTTSTPHSANTIVEHGHALKA